MNEFIKNLDINRLMFVDVEAASQVKELDPESDMFKLFQYKNRNRETEELPSVEETKKLYAKNAALSPVYNRIVAYGLALVKNGEIVTKVITGEEEDILREAFKIIEDSNRIIVGYNSTGWDHPVTRIRASVYGIEAPQAINDSMCKPWVQDEKSPDLLKVIQGTGYVQGRLSLDECCYIYGVPSPKNTGVKGSEVSTEYHTNGVERIKTYLEADLRSTVNLFLRLQGKPIIQ